MAADSAAAALVGTRLAKAVPADALDVRTVKFDLDGFGNTRHLVTSEVYLHAPSVPRRALLEATAAHTVESFLQGLLSYIYSAKLDGNVAVTGSALAEAKWERFLARARRATLFVVRSVAAGPKQVQRLCHLRQLADPTLTGLYIGLPPAAAAVAAAHLAEAGVPEDEGAPALLNRLPAFTVNVNLLLGEADSFGNVTGHVPVAAAPPLAGVPRRLLVPAEVKDSSSPAGVAAVTAAVLGHFGEQRADALGFFTAAQSEGIALGVATSTATPLLASAGASGAVHAAAAMNGGVIPLTSAQQLADPAVTVVYIMVPPPPPVPLASEPVVAPVVPEVDTSVAPPPVQPLAPSAPPAEAPAPAPLTDLVAGDAVEAVAMDGSFTKAATVLAVRPFGVMGDRVVDVQWTETGLKVFGLPLSHIMARLPGDPTP